MDEIVVRASAPTPEVGADSGRVHALRSVADAATMARIAGARDRHLRWLETRLGVAIFARDGELRVEGNRSAVRRAERTLDALLERAERGQPIDGESFRIAVDEASRREAAVPPARPQRSGLGRARTDNQRRYLEAIARSDVVFGSGPAGTGKTFLAVAMAVEALERHEIKRIILTRPAVEAGERLGFLPGDLVAKVNPYLRPLLDALGDLLDPEGVERLVERGRIEIAPLAFMRGRTLSNAFVILDEAQNCTIEQMAMLLTRIGHDAKVVVTGDPSQTDLPRHQPSGLRHALEILSEIDGIEIVRFGPEDVVRHPLVAKIAAAYQAAAAGERRDG